MRARKILVAKLGKSVGLKGFLRFHSKSDFNENFKKGLVLRDFEDKTYTIKEFDKKNNLVKFIAYEELDLAKTLVNKELFMSEEESRQSCKLEKDEYFYFDIINCFVYEQGLFLGEVIDILEQGQSFLLKIKGEKDFYLPYVDEYIISVDIENKKILAKGAKLLLEYS